MVIAGHFKSLTAWPDFMAIMAAVIVVRRRRRNARVFTSIYQITKPSPGIAVIIILVLKPGS